MIAKLGTEIVLDLKRRQTVRRINGLAPIVLEAGYAQTFRNGKGVFWTPELNRGKHKLTSGSTQPHLLVGAALLLEEREQIERVCPPLDAEGVWETKLFPYAVTPLGKLTCARTYMEQPTEGLPEAMVVEMVDALKEHAHNVTNAIRSDLV